MNTVITGANRNIPVIPPSTLEGAYMLLGCNWSHTEEKCSTVEGKGKGKRKGKEKGKGKGKRKGKGKFQHCSSIAG